MPVDDSHDLRWVDDLQLDPQAHRWRQAPAPTTAGFDLLDFAQALEQRDIDYRASHDAPHATIRIINPDNPPSSPPAVHGRPAIRVWLLHATTRDLGLRVTQLVDGGDRVAFTERWHHCGGTTAVATSTAVIQAGLITTRDTILVWDQDPAEV